MKTQITEYSSQSPGSQYVCERGVGEEAQAKAGWLTAHRNEQVISNRSPRTFLGCVIPVTPIAPFPTNIFFLV